MTLKTKLTAALTAIIVLAAAALGVLAVRGVETVLTDQVDAGLRDVAARPLLGAPSPGQTADDAEPRPGPEQPGSTSGYRRYADLLYDSDGTLLTANPSGFTDDPEPLPELSVDEVRAVANSPRTVTVAGDGGPLRVIGRELPTGRIQVIAESMADERATVDQVRRLALLSSAAVVLAAALMSWLVIRRELRPVDQMIDTAAAIATGDLAQRIDPQQSGTELGRLAQALDDMTGQLESAFRQRQEGEDRLRRFAADASHELRTPLTAIRGYAELYRQGGIPAGDRLDQAFQRIESESTRMTKLVEDLLLLARLDQQLPMDWTDVDLDALINETAKDLSAIDQATPVTVHNVDQVNVVGDDRRLRQVLTNLTSNAIRHTPPGTPVHLKLSIDNGSAVIDITDEGPGIDPAIRERVFERFYRADKSRSIEQHHTGAGLGLSIVAGIVAAHHGQVEIASIDQPGTTLRVTLPLHQPPLAPNRQHWPSSPGSTADAPRP